MGINVLKSKWAQTSYSLITRLTSYIANVDDIKCFIVFVIQAKDSSGKVNPRQEVSLL